jgi:hypothetical protein
MTKKTICLFWLLLAGLGQAKPQTVNCLVAFVNGQALTLMDLEIAREFGLFDEAIGGRNGDARLAVLDALIDQKVVLNVARGPAEVGPDEISRAIEGLRDRLGSGAFEARLGKFGLAEGDLRPYLEDRIKYARAVAARFSAAVAVSRGDVEKFYRDVYVPEQTAKGFNAEPIGNIFQELEARIRDDARTRKVTEWIRNIRAQAEIRINRDCLK